LKTIRHNDRFVAAVDRAHALGKPVVLIRVGKSERATRAIVTHTGGPAEEPEMIAELFQAHHVIEVQDLVELTETLAAFQAAKPAAGRRVAVITSSGGLAELVLDVAAARDLMLPPLSAAQKAEIEDGIGFITRDGNPCDAWGGGAFAANLPKVLALFDASPDHDVIVLLRDNLDDHLSISPKPHGATSRCLRAPPNTARSRTICLLRRRA
jgi:acetate---CoA ligase (ADP-forming)